MKLDGTFIVERADAGVARDIARVLRQSIEEMLPFLPSLHTPDEDLAFVRETMMPTNQVYVAKDPVGAVVGFIAFDESWINHLYLLRRCTRFGIGTRLLNIAKGERSYLQLWCFQRNEIARNFYKNHGFVALKETDGADNEEREPDVLLEWRRIDPW